MAKNAFDASSQSPKIQSIAVVGAFSGFENNPECNDYKFVMPMLDYLRKSGVSIADNPQFDAINFADKRNFLDEDNRYDMVLIAHIPNGRNLSWSRMSFDFFSPCTDTTKPEALGNTIDGQNSPNRWAKRIAATGAKIVCSVGTFIEVEQNYLAQSEHYNGYEILITPKNDASLVGRADIFSTDNMPLVYGENLDLPYQWAGIAVQSGYLHTLKSSANIQMTDLGKKIISAQDKISRLPELKLA